MIDTKRNGIIRIFTPARICPEMKIALFISVVICQSAEVLLSVWSENEACGTAPQQIYVFPIVDQKILPPEAPGNLKIPPFYSYMAPPYPLRYCGNLMPEISDDCCFSSIKNYQGVQSGIAKFLDTSNDFHSQLPATVNSNAYCRVFAGIQGNSFPYLEVFILQNSQCLDNFQCLPTGQLRIYEMPGCSGSFEELDSNSNSPLTSTTYGNITTQRVTFNTGTTKVGWVTYYPGKDLVPRYRDGLEVMETVLFVACIAAQLFICIFVFRRFRLWKTQQLFLLLVTQSLLLVFVSVKAAYYYAIFESNYAMWTLNFTQQFLFGLSTLVCTLYGTHVVIEISEPTEAKARQMYLAVLAVHFFLAGSSYLMSLYLLGNWEFNTFLMFWSRLWQVWITVYLISNMIPLSVLMFKKVGTYESSSSSSSSDDFDVWKKCQTIHQIDPYYFLVITVSYLLALLYLIISIVQMTAVLGKNQT
jgi:hypothetical protein